MKEEDQKTSSNDQTVQKDRRIENYREEGISSSSNPQSVKGLMMPKPPAFETADTSSAVATHTVAA